MRSQFSLLTFSFALAFMFWILKINRRYFAFIYYFVISRKGSKYVDLSRNYFQSLTFF